jgi:DNA-binding winged helix-turn-helix (wHTH) protein
MTHRLHWMPPVLRYKFGSFEADVNAAELRRNGSRLKLQMQPFQVLVALLERPQEVVTREELRLTPLAAGHFRGF